MADGWSVTGQRETTAIGPDGHFQPSVVVSFKTDRGYAGTVTVPEANYTAESVKAAIDDKVATLHAVDEL